MSFGLFFSVKAQKSNQNSNFELSGDLLLTIEEYLESAGGENDVDVLELYEYLQQVYQNKLELNKLTKEDLFRLNLLSDAQVNNFFLYRNNFGPFISLHEIQAIPSFDINSIQRILPFVRFDSDRNQNESSIPDKLKNGSHEIILRSQRNLESLAGSLEEDGFLGDPYRHFLRYRFKSDNITAGVLAEKDIGEEWFRGSNKTGFDFYSYHLSVKDLNPYINHIVLGDFTVSMGQGLILHNQFGRGISSFSTNIKKRNGTFRQYTARNEVNYFKGVGLDLNVIDKIKFKVFASKNNIDGTLRDNDDDGLFEAFSSINNSGNHRTDREVLNKNQISRTSIGGILSFANSTTNFSINVLTDNFDKTFERSLRPDNIFFPRQNNYTNFSIDYGHSWRGLNIFGESAYSNGGGLAHLLGALISLDPKLDLALGYRDYAVDYAAITPNAFGQGNNASNEKGTYLGLAYRLNKTFSINAYADFSKNPWLRFRVDSPSTNIDYLLKVNYTIKRKLNAYVLFKTESRLRNTSSDATIDFTAPERTSRFRIHVGQRIFRNFEIRNRAEFSFYKNDTENYKGILVYQDLLFRSNRLPISFTSRFLWFDVEDFDARIYTYENDVLNDFFVPFFSGNGIRYYINLRYRPSRKLTLELRWAQIRYFDRDVISSGLTEITGSVNTNVKAQMRIRL